MSTHVFNVSGDKPDLLTRTLALILQFHGGRGVDGWYVSPTDGLVLCWHKPSQTVSYAPFPARMGAEFLGPMVSAWLNSDEASAIPFEAADEGCPDGDGSNELGWRVYLPNDFYAICAVKPSYCYYGK